MRVTLNVTEGPHRGRAFTFEEHDNFIVGRSERAHFRLSRKDRYFSRIHFLVEVNPPHCRLTDLASRNGTFLNGRRVAGADLKDGDQIQAGRRVLRVCVRPGEPPPVPRPEAGTPSAVPARPVYATIQPQEILAAPGPGPPLPRMIAPPPSRRGPDAECCPVCSGPFGGNG